MSSAAYNSIPLYGADAVLADMGSSSQSKSAGRYHSVDWSFVKNLFTLLNITLRFEFSSALPLYLALVISLVLGEVSGYFVGLVPSQFYQVLLDHDASGFRHLVLKAFALVFTVALVKSATDFVAGLLSLKIRGILTRNLQTAYLVNTSPLTLVHEKAIDNPDQRISQDIDKFSEVIGLLSAKLLLAPLLIIYYTYQCWTLGGWFGPTLIYLNFTLSTVISRLLMTPLARAVFQREYQEGNFRYAHVHVRDSGDEINMLHGERTELGILDNILQQLLLAQRRMVNCKLRLDIFTNAVSYFGSILSYLIIAIPVFAGDYDDLTPSELGAIISKNSFISMYLIYRFTSMLEEADKVSNLAGLTARLIELKYATAHGANADLTKSSISISPEAITLQGTDICAPSGRLLLSKLTYTFPRHQNVLITGPNGVGKTSLLRTIAAQVDAQQSSVMVSSQRPYLCHGSLRDQLLYPHTESYIADADVLSALNAVGISLRIDFDRVYRPDEWQTLLSPGERQKVCLSRIFIRKPSFALLDEATSWMDEASAQRVLDECSTRGVTVIMISHDSSLSSRFDKVLSLAAA